MKTIIGKALPAALLACIAGYALAAGSTPVPAAPAEQKAQPAKQAAPAAQDHTTQPLKPIPSTPGEQKAPPAKQPPPIQRGQVSQPAKQAASTPRQGDTQPRFQSPSTRKTLPANRFVWHNKNQSKTEKIIHR